MGKAVLRESGAEELGQVIKLLENYQIPNFCVKVARGGETTSRAPSNLQAANGWARASATFNFARRERHFKPI